MAKAKQFTLAVAGIVASAAMLVSGCRGQNAENETATQPAAPENRDVLGQTTSAPVVRTVPAGTALPLEMLTAVGSDRSQAGDSVRARVTRDVLVDGRVAIPAGTTASGVVTEAVGLKKIGGRARLALEFRTLDPPQGAPSTISARFAAVGKSETKKDAATIAGSTIGGAVLGRIIGHQSDRDARGTAIGAVVGAGTGTAIAAKTKGQEIVLSRGVHVEVDLDAPAQVTIRG